MVLKKENTIILLNMKEFFLKVNFNIRNILEENWENEDRNSIFI